MNISVRLEGGLGDCILATRFVPAIKEKYPNSEITAYLDTEGQTFQSDALRALFPSLFKDINVILRKKYKSFLVDSQFGTDTFTGSLDNVPDDARGVMESYDKFYDLHIDSLKFTQADFDWKRYFYFFPKPEIAPADKSERYFVLHLSSTNLGNAHRMEEWYLTGLVSRLAKLAKCKVISSAQTRDYLACLNSIDNVEIIELPITELAAQIGSADLFLSIDSGLKYIAYCYGVPVICLTEQAFSPHQVHPHFKIRWLPFPEDCLPLYFDSKIIASMASSVLENKGVSVLLPYYSDFNKYAVNRIYTVNENSKLNT